MESSINISLDMSGLDTVYEACKVLEKKVRVGIPDDKPDVLRKGEGAEYGFITDDGRIAPARSVLETALTFGEEIIKEKSLDKLVEMTPDVSRETLEELGNQALEAINEGFKTRGYGTWQDNAPWTIRIKGRNDPNIDTGELSKSYEYEVEE